MSECDGEDLAVEILFSHVSDDEGCYELAGMLMLPASARELE
jgi:hypothetical protein